MTITQILYLIFYILAAVGILLIVGFAVAYIISILKTRTLRKQIPDKIKKEVEDARLKREQTRKDAAIRYGAGIDFIPGREASYQPEIYEPLVDNRDKQVERRNQPVDRHIQRRRKLRRI